MGHVLSNQEQGTIVSIRIPVEKGLVCLIDNLDKIKHYEY